MSDEHLVDDDAAGVDVVARQPVEHERVVGIGTVRDGDCVFRSCAVAPASLRGATRARPCHSVDGEVDVRVGRRAAEAEADRGAGTAGRADRLAARATAAWLPELQADPVETARSPSAISSRSPSTSSKLTCRLCGRRRSPASPFTRTPSSRAEVRRAAGRAALPGAPPRPASRVRQISAAAPRPTMPGTLSVPERKPVLVATAVDLALELRASASAAHEQRAGALRPVVLVPGQREQIDAHRLDVDRNLARRPARRRCATARRARVRSRRSRRAAAARRSRCWRP